MSFIQIIEKYPEITIIHHRQKNGTLWATSGRKILYRNSNSGWLLFNKFPISYPRDLFSFSRPASRAMRSDKSNIYVNAKNSVIGIRGNKVYSIEEKKQPKELLQINGDSVLHGGICEDAEGNIFFGEYFMNPNRIPVIIWKVSADLTHWESVFSFPEGSARHVHGIYPDPYESGIFWVTVGDFENECYFYKFDQEFNLVEKYGDGTQLWRAVRIFFTEEHILWLTDSNLDQNYACRMNRDTQEIEIGQKIDASAWYGSKTEDGIFVAFTTVEPGSGIKTSYSSLLTSKDGFKWSDAARFKKDSWRPMKLFKYGVISCPSGVFKSDEFFISGEGLQGFDGISMKIKISA